MVMMGDNAGDICDALGRRVEVVNFADVAAGGGARTYQYYYDGQRAIYEDVYTGLAADPANHALALYTVFGNYIDEVLVMNDGTDDFYYVHDHLYSTVALYKIDSDSGDFSLAERYEYDAYGKANIFTAGADATWFTADDAATTQSYSTVGNPYTFTGRRLDTLDDGGYSVMYYRARYYDTETGRFMQRDPLGIDPAGGKANPFSAFRQYFDDMILKNYVKGNPVIFLDPMGRKRSLNPVEVLKEFDISLVDDYLIDFPDEVPGSWTRTVTLPTKFCGCLPRGEYIQYSESRKGSFLQIMYRNWSYYRGKGVCYEEVYRAHYDMMHTGGTVMSSLFVPGNVFRGNHCIYRIFVDIRFVRLDKLTKILQLNHLRGKDRCTKINEY